MLISVTRRTNLLRASLLVLVGILSLAQSPAWAQSGQFGRRDGAGGMGRPMGRSPDRAPTFRQRVAQDGGPSFGADQTQPLVSDVKIKGNETVSEVKVQAFLKSKPGRRFDPEVVQADVHRLMSSGLFADVRASRAQTDQGVIVSFEVFERPTIRYIRFIGNRGVSDRELTKQSGIELGDAMVMYNVEEARRKVEEYYHGNGYTKTQVVVSEGNEPRDRGVVLLVHEGKRQRVSSVSFIGNTIATDARLKTRIKSKPGFLWRFFGGDVDNAKIDEDMDRLTAYYRSLGFFNARVGRELQYDDSGDWLNLRFVIDEGPRYKIRNLSLVGNQKFASDDLIERMNLRTGDHFNLAELNRDVNMLRDMYGGQGHIFADIKADPRFLETPGELDMVFNINEGDIFRVGSINVHVEGEYPHTRRNVVLNRLSLRPGDLIDIREVRSSERRLKAAQLFLNDPSQGAVPRIVIRPPDVRSKGSIAKNKPRHGAMRGQSPDPVGGPNVQMTEMDVYVPTVRRDSSWPHRP